MFSRRSCAVNLHPPIDLCKSRTSPMCPWKPGLEARDEHFPKVLLVMIWPVLQSIGQLDIVESHPSLWKSTWFSYMKL